MARLGTVGFESNRVGTVNTEMDGNFGAGGAAATIVTSPVRSGGFAASCASGAGNATSFTQFITSVFAASTTYYVRGHLCFAQLPTATVPVIGFTSGQGCSLKVTSGGKVQLFQTATNAQIGSDSAATLVADSSTWYRFEVSLTFNGSTQGASCEGYLNGVLIAQGNITTPAAVGVGLTIGWGAAPGASKTLYVDDVALNDSTGASQNSYPGDGKVVLLIPTATSAAGTGWVLGNNTAEGGNGWNSVNNEPPVGIADLGGAGADTGQIRNATAAANSNFDATMTTYTAAGVGTGSTVNVVTPVTATAAPVTTSAKAGTVGVVSNPAITNVALSAAGTAGAFWQGNAGATYPTGWKWSFGTATYAPSVTLGTAPVMRVTQVTSSTRIAMVCFMGIIVEFIGVTTAKSGFGKENA